MLAISLILLAFAGRGAIAEPSCGPKEPKCPKYEHYVTDDVDCPKTCGNRQETAGACAPYTGCVCDHGYVRPFDNATGTCIWVRKCAPIPKKCGINEVPSSCEIVCPPQTCDSIFTTYMCHNTECKPGCNCKNNFLRNSKGVCIPSDDCANDKPKCQDNASWVECRSACPPTCEDNGDRVCIAVCLEPGCQCDAGYVLNYAGQCVLPKDCPVLDKCKNHNATFSECPGACPATCAKPETNKHCTKNCLNPGCVCNQGYLLNKRHGVCIWHEDCPGGSPVCPANETYAYCKAGCPTNFCPVDDSRAIVACSPPYPCPSGCVCQEGYLRLSVKHDRCILASDCPPVKCTRKNEEWNPQPLSCRTERCEDLITPPECNKPYPYDRPACVCQYGYYRNKEGICVPGSECLHCEERNATFSECRTACPATCEDPNANTKPCILICRLPGCECKPGYVLTPDGQCVLPQDCPGQCKDPNASYSNCTSACPATCSDPGARNKPCIAICMEPGCECNPGYLLNESSGECTLPEYCPDCYGDRNATYSDCPSGCAATCADPDRNILCKRPCLEPGCECKFGYIRTEIGGKCVLPEDCTIQCADPNASFSACPSSCPAKCGDTGDTFCIQVCAPPGCVCNTGYVLSDRQCVLPENCPVDEQNCKAHNATYKECRSACPARCSTINSGDKLFCPTVCREPGCECTAGYVLDDKDRCILPEDCPVDTCCIPKKCRRTCGNPNPADCPYKPAETNIDGCECIEGYILSEEGGKCIEIESCPADQSCNGDPHARVKKCPPPCPSTCKSPNQSPCKRMCDPIGCVCESGYIYSDKHRKCVLPSDCPGGDPCGPTAMFSSCNFDCPHNFCPQDDSREIILCKPPRDCPSGCVCRLNHKRLSYENRTCIVSSTCPPVDCTRQHEVWDTCPECLAENCEDVNNQPTTCNTLVLNCQPKCICEKNHFRNGSDICIPAADCPKPVPQCGYNEIAVECRTICPPQNCEIAYTDYACGEPKCEPGCDCLPNHLRNGSGICILNDDCPYPTSPICGINEIARDCRRICPPQTCLSKIALYRCAENIPCEAGCDCVANYLRDANGVCIPSEECFASGKECGPNSRLIECANSCPTDFCPVDDSRAIVACDPTPICEAGCICDLNHKKLSYKNQTCVVSSDCPKVECTRPNEVWAECPECLAEMCSDANNPPSVCNTFVLNCQPKCICIKDHFRNSKDLCVTREECLADSNS